MKTGTVGYIIHEQNDVKEPKKVVFIGRCENEDYDEKDILYIELINKDADDPIIERIGSDRFFPDLDACIASIKTSDKQKMIQKIKRLHKQLANAYEVLNES